MESSVSVRRELAAAEQRAALLLIDLQHDFLDMDGPMYVPGAEALLPTINALLEAGRWAVVAASKDWHPPDHISFANSHPGRKMGDVISMLTKDGLSLPIKLFPTHCVANTLGAEFASGLESQHLQHIILKGRDADREAMSAFYDAGHVHSTGLGQILKDERVSIVYVCGVATEYCVLASVLDALREGFAVGVVVDAVAASSEEAGQEALLQMQHAGAALVQCSQLVDAEVLKERRRRQRKWEQQWEAGWEGAIEP